jgi:DNA invertase Pin-like site-specific DNA recombinase
VFTSQVSITYLPENDRYTYGSTTTANGATTINLNSDIGDPTVTGTPLNILLSFAQCERELIGERTRDKMSAARRKGKWVGGCPVLGYDVDPGRGRLVVNAEEADRVRTIFRSSAAGIAGRPP